MLDFSYATERLPSRHSVCVVWHKVKMNGADCLIMNLQLATYENGKWVWVANNEPVDVEKKGEIVQYIEIPAEYHNQYINHGTLWNRVKGRIAGEWVDDAYKRRRFYLEKACPEKSKLTLINALQTRIAIKRIWRKSRKQAERDRKEHEEGEKNHDQNKCY